MCGLERADEDLSGRELAVGGVASTGRQAVYIEKGSSRTKLGCHAGFSSRYISVKGRGCVRLQLYGVREGREEQEQTAQAENCREAPCGLHALHHSRDVFDINRNGSLREGLGKQPSLETRFDLICTRISARPPWAF
jgi:hypothetical protein